ncbi:FAD-binding domain-containing protein [Mycena amicta]|nr:FAD-binding domain-containing protein [Mycena amicta]
MLPLRTLALTLSLSLSAVVAQDATVSDATAAALACRNVTTILGPTIVQSSGAQYNATAQGTWSLFNSLDKPTCIVYPTSAAHVQTAMAAIYASNSKYAVIAGGHSGMVGYNSITNGVLISFSSMQNISYSTTTGLVTLQPGIHWGDAIDYLESYGVAVMGARASDVGTGLLLGGGISYLAPQHGWSSDAIQEVDMVLVDGRLVTATATNEFKDLFQAIKGGANRFGIATRYVLVPVSTGTAADKNWYGGMMIFPGSDSAIISNATAKFVRENTDSKAILMLIANTMDLTSPTANVVYMYYQGSSLPTSIFGTFLSLNATVTSLSAVSYVDMANTIPGNARGNGQNFGAASFIGNEATFWKGFQLLSNFTAQYGDQLDACHLVVSVVPRSQWAASKARGPNAIGDPGVAYAAMNYYAIYPAGVLAPSPAVKAGFETLLSQVQFPENKGLPLYINECDAAQHVFATYPAFETLKSTYAKYDPTRFNVRNTLGPIGL